MLMNNAVMNGNDRKQLLWQMTAQQFAAFDTQLYLDTHPGDNDALQTFNQYRQAHSKYRSEYESKFGPISSDNTESGAWSWVNDPWPWEREAN